MDDLIYLIKESYTRDEIGQMVPKETARAVWASVSSVTRAEWRDGGQNGLQPQLVAITPVVNYEGEKIVQMGDGEKAERYGVYRTYFPPDSDMIELYMEKKVGVYVKKSEGG